MSCLVMLPAKTIKALLRVAPTDDVRKYLNGVYFDPAGYAVATDGKALMAIRTDNPFDGEGFTVPRAPLEAAVRASKPRATVSLDRSNIHYLNKTTNQTAIFDAGTYYPDWRRVIPEKCSGETAWYDCEVLERLRKAREDLSDSKMRKVIIIAHNGTSAGVVDTRDSDVLMIVSPMGTGDGCDTAAHVSQFLSPKKTPATQSAA